MISTYKRVIKYLKPYLNLVILSIVIAMVYSAVNALHISLTRDLLNILGKLTGKPSEAMLMTFSLYVLYIILLRIARLVCNFFQTYIMSYVSNRIIVDMRMALYENIQKLSLDFFKKWHIGDIISRLFNDISVVQAAVMAIFTSVLSETLSLVTVMGMIVYLNWKLAFLTLLMVPVLISIVDIFGRRMKLISGKLQKKSGDIVSIIQEVLSSILVVKSFTMEEHEIRRFSRQNEKNFKISMKGVKYESFQKPIIELLQVGTFALIIWFGGYQVFSGSITAPELGAFFVGVMMMIDPVISLSKVYTQAQKALASSRRVFMLLDMEPTVRESSNPVILQSVKGDVDFKNVSFSYEKSEGDVLKNINLSIKSGEVVALVGASGSGKSTFISLISRFYDPTSGEIMVDGNNLRDCKITSLREQIALVPQESILFSGSIRDNICYGSPAATTEGIEKAADMANASEFINRLNHRYYTRVGEKGARLSGGQKQRISIARAILRDPRILILDEATSSLDTESERLVQDALNKLMTGRTCFVIAHRLSTIINADRILVFENGSIVEEGKHDDLLKIENGCYRKLYELQFRKKS